ncbi:MAG: NUDIX pyrophosphatase [Ruminococcaceae bacterium]|nr:NUDIX pyrophosphatase [Oscillospiraceae bacterium]
MARAKYQVLVIPFVRQKSDVLYCVFRRRDMADVWQFIAGGGEDEDAAPLAAALREASEEAGIREPRQLVALESVCSIPTECFPKARAVWGEACLVIPEYAFAAELWDTTGIKLSAEHTEYRWVNYQDAVDMLRYDSNKTALWELDNKLRLALIP